MATGDAVTAGKITTAFNTTDLVAEQRFDNFRPTDFSGTVIFRVGPSDSPQRPRGKAGRYSGAWAFGRDGHDRARRPGERSGPSGVGVLGVGGQPYPYPENPAQGGIGVQGIAGGVADGVVGTSSAPGKSGVFGFNSLNSQRREDVGYGVFGRCDTPNGAGVGAESALGVGARAHSGGNDGVVGLSDAANKSGVFGFNSMEGGVGYGLFGRCDADRGPETPLIGARRRRQGTQPLQRRCGRLERRQSQERGLRLQFERERRGVSASAVGRTRQRASASAGRATMAMARASEAVLRHCGSSRRNRGGSRGRRASSRRIVRGQRRRSLFLQDKRRRPRCQVGQARLSAGAQEVLATGLQYNQVFRLIILIIV